jgi:hypothetical protein
MKRESASDAFSLFVSVAFVWFLFACYYAITMNSR